MSHEVILPALGMAQDTGRLVAWLKQPGEAVAVGDVLFEVETDKSVAEVEAQHAGFLTDVTAGAGEDVPVGQVIARISATAEDSGTATGGKAASPEVASATGTAAATDGVAAADGASATDGALVPDATAVADATAGPAFARTAPGAGGAAAASGGRIFASPRARRLAAEEGLDLARLAAAGHPQPYHTADLEVLRTLPLGRNSPGAGPGDVLAPQALVNQIGARVPRQGVTDFIDWMQREGGVTLPPSALFVAFAARALRGTCEAGAAAGTAPGEATADLVVALAPLGQGTIAYANPDRSRLSMLQQVDTGATADADPDPDADPDRHARADLLIRDLTGSRLTHLRLAAGEVPTLSIAEAGDSYELTLVFTDRQLTEDRAVACMTDLANRLADPLLSVL